VSVTALAIIAFAGAGVGNADAGTAPDKVVVCHATASNTNPWVRVEVSVNALPAHLGEVGNSHQRQQSLGRHDFVWTPSYDEDCVAVPQADPITVACSGLETQPVPVIGITNSGAQVSIPCPSIHSQVTLPVGVHLLVCSRGSVAAPYPVTYQLHPGGLTYVVNCVVGQTVDLGVQGGRLQVVCPAEGSVSFYAFDFFGGLEASPVACQPGTLVPNGSTPWADFVGSIDWSLTLFVPGNIMCPASGTLGLYFLGEGAPSTTPLAATGFPCVAGTPVDVTRLVLTA